MHKVVLSHSLYEDGMKLLEKEAEVFVANTSRLEEKLQMMESADAVVLRVGCIDRNLMKHCPNLKVIARPGVGVDTVDIQAANEMGIAVVISPGTNLRSVAEHSMALLYTLSKNILESHLETAKGNFNIRNKYASVELQKKRAGIIGFGNIGKETARIMHNNEIEISVFDPFVSPNLVLSLGYQYEKNLIDLLSSCDVISLHMPSTSETRGMFGEKEIKAMRRGAFLINCARGDIIDESALYKEGLASGHLGGVATDVMNDEPMDPGHPLFKCSNFIATPHMAALTKEGASRTSTLTAQGVLELLKGNDWPHVYNPEVFQHFRWR